jgi:HK97 family phage prohead protease
MDRLEFAATYDIEGDTLSGVAHVFGERTMREGRLVEFSPTAFGKSLARAMAFYSHDTSKPLARPRLEVRDGRLHYSMTLGHQSYAEDLRINVRDRLMDRMSFGVTPRRWSDSRDDKGAVVRTYTAADLFDISPVALPAFAGTEAMLHEAADDRREQMARARFRVLEGAHRV